jgi:hypothetical protein
MSFGRYKNAYLSKLAEEPSVSLSVVMLGKSWMLWVFLADIGHATLLCRDISKRYVLQKEMARTLISAAVIASLC